MLFTSLEFVFLFLPIVLAVNFILPKQVRNYWLMLASFFFYGWGEPHFLVVMLASILFNYFSALKLAELRKEGNEAYCKFTLVFAVSTNILLLFVYKYMNFVTSWMIRYLPGTSSWITQTSYVLPIGISFFTFQAISYIVDVYRGTQVQKNAGYVALYISLFPQLIAGPIVRYNTVKAHLRDRTITSEMFSRGVLRFLRGFNKKILLSNILSIVVDASWEMSDRTICMAWLGALCYSLQIYYDFSGYSDMAIGLGGMLGFSFPENFNYPYVSKTISEFWRRWHISLSTWFRDYIYFPLGGSRVNTKRRLVFNLCVVWILTGIWHGANWTFIAWGCLYAFFICAEKLLEIEKKAERNFLFSSAYRLFTLLIIMLLWVLFRSSGIHDAWHYLCSMLGICGNDFCNETTIFYMKEYRTVILLSLACSVPIFKELKERLMRSRMPHIEWTDGLTGAAQLLLMLVSVSYLIMDAHNPFIYFNF